MKLLLTDVDGVLLDWEFAFHTWMEEHGHTAERGHKLVYSVAKRFGITGKNAKKLTFMKPLSYINNSGIPVKKFIKNTNIKAENILIVYDDLDLSVGKTRVKLGGSSAGHKGLEILLNN